MYFLTFILAVDLDGSGKIEFDEFLDIMLRIKRGKSDGSDKNSAMFDFFQSNISVI
jgi:Ca2+-binding EF-hand superfamily protein